MAIARYHARGHAALMRDSMAIIALYLPVDLCHDSLLAMARLPPSKQAYTDEACQSDAVRAGQ